MKESELNKVRNEYNKIIKEKETLISYKNELIELTNNEQVKRFLELEELVDEDYLGPSEETMIMKAYQEVPGAFGNQTINSNHIMVYMGNYIKKGLRKQNEDYMTYERNPDTSYKSYMDLETTEWYNIDKDKFLEFETEYLTLYLPISEYTEEEYYKKYTELQKWFKIQLIHRSQLDVIKELQEKYEREYKNKYPLFQRIDTIADLPIEEYVKKHHEEGFIENFCLSKDEHMRVKLYRKQLKKKLYITKKVYIKLLHASYYTIRVILFLLLKRH